MPLLTLRLTGQTSEFVPHEFIRQQGDTDHLAVFLPGFAYPCDMPIFYYAETLLLAAGVDLLRMAYAYDRDPTFRGLHPDHKIARLLADASPAIGAALTQRTYDKVTVVAKSLGTLTLAHLLARNELPRSTIGIWTTPILTDDAVVEAIKGHPGQQLIVIGENDPAYDADQLRALATVPNVQIVTIRDADHSLDIPGDTIGSIAALSTTIKAMASLTVQEQPLTAEDNGP